MYLFLGMSLGINLLLFFLTIRILKKNFADIFLLGLLSIVLTGTSYVILFNYFQLKTNFLTHFINSLPILIGCLTYLYVLYSINSIKKIQRRNLIHLLPVLLAIPLSYYDIDGVFIISIILNIGLKIVISICYFIFSLQLLKRHKKVIENHFSKTENIDLKWLAFVVKVGLISYIIYFLIMIVWVTDVQIVPNIETYPNFIVIIYILALSYYGLSSTKVFEHISNFNIETNIQVNYEVEAKSSIIINSEKKELLSRDKSEQILNQLIEIIETKKLYKNENLKLEDLAKEIDIHSKYLSYSINSISGKNFFDFVNHFRIIEFNTEVLKPENENLTYLSIAFDCGFGSKSAFNRAYKSEMGISPSEFIKSIKIK